MVDETKTTWFAAAAVTVKVVEPETPLMVAVMVEVPAATPVARPPLEVIVALAVVPELQVADDVTVAVELSL